MSLHTKVCLVVVGIFLASLLVQNECRKLHGYKFPVYATTVCPRNETEWIERSSALNCNKSNGYTCLPNENFDQLLEYCYIVPVERIQKGFCLYLVKRVSRTQSYSCRNFAQGCHNQSFFSNEIYKYPACISLGNGCFLAEPSCKSITPPHIQSTTQQFKNDSINEWNRSTNNDNDGALFAAILLGIFILLCILSLMFGYYIKRIRRRKDDVLHEENEIGSLLGDTNHSNNGTDCIHELDKCIPSSGIDKVHRKEDELHEKDNKEPLLGDKIHSVNGTDCNHEEEESTPSIEKDKKKINQVHRKEDEVDEKDKNGSLLGDKIHSVNRTDCSHEKEESTPSIEKGKEKIKQVHRKEVDVELHEKDDNGPLLGDKIHSVIGTDCSHEEEECTPSIEKDKEKINQESPMENSIFNQWEQGDSCFISTKASKEVKKKIKSRNLVIVAGHSGSGKSSIIQHIALKYRKQGWTVRRVTEVKDIVNEYSSSRFQENKTICVFNDPLGKESVDEKLNKSWQKYEEEMTTYLNTAKLIMSCRNYIISDRRITRYLVQHSDIVDINNDKHKFSEKEKIQILNKYLSNLNLSKEECNRIVKTERYFPLLCKLYSKKKECLGNIFKFFEEPVIVLKGEISDLKDKHKEKYLALVLLVLYNNKLCIGNLLENIEYTEEFKRGLHLCGFNSMAPFEVGNHLDSLNGYLVKNVGDTYHFYHDFVMEVTTQVFGTDYPTEIIKYADIGFLRRRVKLENFDKHDDSFTIYLSDNHIEKLGERLYTELFGERLVDVVLNPCLKNEKVIEVLKKKIEGNPENHHMLLETKKLSIDIQKLDWTSKTVLINKLEILELENEVSPLLVLIVFCHTQLSLYCLNFLKQKLTGNSFFSAVCCNGSTELFNYVCKDNAEEPFKKTWGDFCHIHIVSLFHNYDLLNELIKEGVDVNKKTDNYGGWTPLMLAAVNDIRENEDYNRMETGAERRDKTVQLLLNNKADINSRGENGAGPLYIACQNGHESTVQLLLSNEANINLFNQNRSTPLYIACHNGHESTVQLLLSNGADINLSNIYEKGPLYIACQNGHDSIVKLLLSKEAENNFCKEDEKSPFHVACQNGHDSIVQLLLSNGADINFCNEKGESPLYIACQNGHDSTVQLLLSYRADINLCNKNKARLLDIACQNGHDSTVQLLLSNGANINFCIEDGTSPLHTACFKGQKSTVQLLLSNGADINLCDDYGASPLLIACYNGRDSTVQLLLRNGANINLCDKNGASPLFKACQGGNDSTVQLLLSNGANINSCNKYGDSPLYIACFNGHDSIVQLLLSNRADINLCDEDGESPLYIACHNGHESTVQLLLSNGADINLSNKNEHGPLYIACQNGHDSLVKLLLSNGADNNYV